MTMEAILVRLPPILTQQIRQELSVDEVPSQVIAEAVQMWLERRREARLERERILQTLGQAGVIMPPERQRALAKAMMASLSLEEVPPRGEVEATLTRLKVPLSAEIIAMRRER